MLYDVMVYHGIKREWLIGKGSADQMLERAFKIPEWVLFRFGNHTYYRTFENHIYMVKKVKR